MILIIKERNYAINSKKEKTNDKPHAADIELDNVLADINLVNYFNIFTGLDVFRGI